MTQTTPMAIACALANENEGLAQHAERVDDPATWARLALAYDKEADAWRDANHPNFDERTRGLAQKAREKAVASIKR